MTLHLGGENVVCLKDVVAIFDAACADAQANRDLLSRAATTGDFSDQPDCASYIVAMIDGKQKILTSPISSATLLHRAREMVVK